MGYICPKNEMESSGPLFCKDLLIPECYDHRVYCTDVPTEIIDGQVLISKDPTNKYRTDPSNAMQNQVLRLSFS